MKREKGSSITRVLEIIDLVSSANHPLSAATIADALDIPKPSVHRLLQQLADEQYLAPNLRGHWEPAPRLRTMALGILDTGRFRAQHHAVLQQLASHIGETCGLSVAAASGASMTYFDRAQTNWPLQIHLPVGSDVPITCTASGKLYLASFPKAARERLLRQLPLQRMARNTIVSADLLSARLDEIADSGIGLDNEEFIDGMVACAVPVQNAQQRFVASLFVHAPVVRTSLDDLLAFVPSMREAARALL